MSKVRVTECEPRREKAEQSFVGALRSIVGAENVDDSSEQIADRMTNVSGFKRHVAGIVRPQTTSQVQQIVQVANERRCPLYPISRGKNWGLGSKLPVRDGCVVVDLSRMNCIREVNQEFGYAVIEPGVTQGQLSDRLGGTQSPFFVDVTGSGRDTSIIGNTLERGVAYNSQRIDGLLNLEVVLGNGRLVRTGYGHYENSQVAGLVPYGLGPELSGVFVQSNFGIVTAASIRLLPVPEHHCAFVLNMRNEEQLGVVVESLRQIARTGVLQSVVHIGNRRRGETTLAPLLYEHYSRNGNPVGRDQVRNLLSRFFGGSWNAIGSLMGTRSHVRVACKLIRKRLAPFADVSFMTPRKLAFAKGIANWFRSSTRYACLDAIEPLLGLTRGVPTDAALRSAYWPGTTKSRDYTDVDRSDWGLLYCVPVIPMSAAGVEQALEICRVASDDYGFTTGITLNMLHDSALEGVISIDYDRRDEQQRKKAFACIAAMNKAFIEAGFHPQRIDIDNMPMVMDPNDTFWQTANALKQALDPNGIIAPGRYNLG